MGEGKEKRLFEDSPVYFLGVCDRYNEPIIGTGPYFDIFRTDLIGLRQYYASSIFPFSSEGMYLVFLIDNNKFSDPGFLEGGDLKIKIKNPNKESISDISISGEIAGIGDAFPTRFGITAARIPGSYSGPGLHKVFLENSEQEILIGEFQLIYNKPLPMTEERRRALKSDPLAAKWIKIGLSCNHCGDSMWAVAGIEKEKEQNKSGTWYEDLPDEFVCKCGKVRRNLQYIREGLHSLLGYKPNPFSESEQIERNYTRGALDKIARNFWVLIENKEASEEKIQEFIEHNPIMLSIFSPKLLKFKAPATTKFKTDFALLNQKGELILIEIEPANIPLFTSTGTQHSKLTHAIGQVQDWLQEGKRNRLGLIDDLGIENLTLDMVTSIKGVVIAGRSLEEYEKHLGKLHDRGDIIFYTYDDLFKSFRKIIENIENI